MCDPATIGIITTIGSTALSAYSAYSTGQSQKAAAAYNSRVAENEAQSSRNMANEAENAQRLKTSRLLSKQRAQFGAANIDLSSGSALQLQEDTITLGEADALRIRTSGDSQFDASMNQSTLETTKGNAAESQSFLNIGSSLLSGAGGVINSGVADKWFTAESVSSPFATKSNPLGLTAGQGL